MDQKELEGKWNEMLGETFDRFIRENVGYKEGSAYPACYGTGDNRTQCAACKFKGNC